VTVSYRFQSHLAQGAMGVPDDANPMNRRLPAEVVTRKKQNKKDEKEETNTLPVDPKQVHGMKPDHRLKWLTKALQKCQEGKVEKTVIFDIMTHAKFCHDCSSKLGGKMYRLVRAHADLFSQKQKKFLEGGDCAMQKLFKKAVRKGEADAEEAPAPPSSRREKDASRSRDTRGADIAALWDQLTALSAQERAARVAALDEATKEQLEEFLEARISAQDDCRVGSDREEHGQRSVSDEEDASCFSVTLRKLDLILDTSDGDYLIIKEITPAVSKWNKSKPEQTIQVFDRLMEVDGDRAAESLAAVTENGVNGGEASLVLQRPQQRTITLKRPEKLGFLANYVPTHSLKPWIDTIAGGALEDWNKASPEHAVQAHDRIVSVNDVSEPPEEMLFELARKGSSLRLTCLHYPGLRHVGALSGREESDSERSRSRSRSRRRR